MASVLGIWDGHDSSVALVEDKKIIFANNEEKYNELKLWSGWPKLSINHVSRKYHDDFDYITFTTSDLGKTIQRIIPKIKENYYYFRRHKKYYSFPNLRRHIKYFFNTFDFSNQLKSLNDYILRQKYLKLHKINYKKTLLINHHLAHASAGIFTSNFSSALVVTYDGVGDGICSSVYAWENGEIRKLMNIEAKHSIGLFFEQATNVVGMRELEDEGKLMSLADYYIPKKDEKNPFQSFFYLDNLKLKSKYGAMKNYKLLRKAYFFMSRERFAYWVQKTLEFWMLKYLNALLKQYPFNNLILSGGVFSNIKLNKKIREELPIKNLYVFPNMGDGGLALGSALYINFLKTGIKKYKNVKENHFVNYLGDEINTDILEQSSFLQKFKNNNISVEYITDPSKFAAELISEKKIVLYAQGKTEYGPRALGNRSILALPNSLNIKQRLNLMIKCRDWFMPFAPTILEKDAKKYLQKVNIPNYHMTNAYEIDPKKSDEMQAVIHVDYTTRPQFLNENNIHYFKLLKRIKKLTGLSLVLNTSFNLHGLPIVNNFEQALKVLLNSDAKHMILGNYYLFKNN